MHMPSDQAKRFCYCLDSLTMFANEKLHLSDNLSDAREGRLRDAERNIVAKGLWADPAPIIDEYLSVNPDGLPQNMLLEIAQIMDDNPLMSQRTVERFLQKMQAEGYIEKIGAA